MIGWKDIKELCEHPYKDDIFLCLAREIETKEILTGIIKANIFQNQVDFKAVLIDDDMQTYENNFSNYEIEGERTYINNNKCFVLDDIEITHFARINKPK